MHESAIGRIPARLTPAAAARRAGRSTSTACDGETSARNHWRVDDHAVEGRPLIRVQQTAAAG